MPEGGMNVELASRELCSKIKEGEAKLEEGSIEEAETSLREALSLNNEVRRFVCFSFFLSCCVCAAWRRGITSSSPTSSSSCTEKKTNKNLILKKPDRGGGWGKVQEARALLGRLEYQRGNIEGALQVFEGIELTALVSRMRFFLLEAKNRNRKGKPPKDGTLTNFLHAASLLLEAIYLKAKSLQKLGRLSGFYPFFSLCSYKTHRLLVCDEERRR
jgi:hypothetical protein